MVAKRIAGKLSLRRKMRDGVGGGIGIGKPSVCHALIVIFLEFFAWGLLTSPMLTVTHETFQEHTFLMNGLVMGIKGMLSFLSAPLLGALSDTWGRKSFLLISVFFTCLPIPLMRINSMWFFAVLSLSGTFAVTFSVVLAYVADVTTNEERSHAYGMVSATFAASLITSPAVGAYLAREYNDVLVVALATAISVLDLFFILVAVPESLSEKIRTVSWGKPISWEKADPFAALRRIGQDNVVMLVCGTVFLSYLPEAGQYSSFFLYLKQVLGFSSEDVAVFIAVVGILSVFAQSVVMAFLIKSIGNKKTILCGLIFQMMQLSWFAIARDRWMIWCAGMLAGLSSIIYPAISALVSTNAEADQQGVVQGIVTGVRGLCSGLGPALFGFSFYIFHIDFKEDEEIAAMAAAAVAHNADKNGSNDNLAGEGSNAEYTIPGPAFAIGAVLVMFAFFLATLIPENFTPTLHHPGVPRPSGSTPGPSLLSGGKLKGGKKMQPGAKCSPNASDDESGYANSTSDSVPLISKGNEEADLGLHHA